MNVQFPSRYRWINAAVNHGIVTRMERTLTISSINAPFPYRLLFTALLTAFFYADAVGLGLRRSTTPTVGPTHIRAHKILKELIMPLLEDLANCGTVGLQRAVHLHPAGMCERGGLYTLHASFQVVQCTSS